MSTKEKGMMTLKEMGSLLVWCLPSLPFVAWQAYQGSWILATILSALGLFTSYMTGRTHQIQRRTEELDEEIAALEKRARDETFRC